MYQKHKNSMKEGAIIILRYLKENYKAGDFLELSERELSMSEQLIKALMTELSKEKLIEVGAPGEYYIDSIRIKGKMRARITLKGVDFLGKSKNFNIDWCKVIDWVIAIYGI
jgi:hypothetical protein